MTKVVFMGTPEFAVPSLRALHNSPDFEVVSVVTQPDRPAGRGRQLRHSPVKEYAIREGLPTLQPESLRQHDAIEAIAMYQPNVIVVAAFGQILRLPVLDLPPKGCINVHASLLPRWRGAAPIQFAIRSGDAETGITIMKMDEGLDTGPILTQAALPIEPEDTGQSLHDKLARLGGEILPSALREYVNGQLLQIEQTEAEMTYAPMLQKEDGLINWQSKGVEIERQVRAFYPWPGCYTIWADKVLKVLAGHCLESGAFQGKGAGTIVKIGKQMAVITEDGLYVLDWVQPQGKEKMTGQAFLAGHPDCLESVLT